MYVEAGWSGFLNYSHNLNAIDTNVDILKVCLKRDIMNASNTLYILEETGMDRNNIMNKQIHFESEIIVHNLFSVNKKILGNNK